MTEKALLVLFSFRNISESFLILSSDYMKKTKKAKFVFVRLIIRILFDVMYCVVF